MSYERDLAARIRAHLADHPGVTEKAMFGGLAFLVDGHMAAAAGGKGGLMLRCDPERTDELLGRPGAEPQEMRGRPMRGWVSVDSRALDDDADLHDWVDDAVAYTRTLPPKA